METMETQRRERLDQLFLSYELVAEGAYAYICDMKADCSRWSKAAVDYFGLPGEYMIAAGKIWEEHVHPEDRESYRMSIEAIMRGDEGKHDLQYRATDREGNYVMCTCRGVVLRDKDGEPVYFCGFIRNHGLLSHIDPLTGLRNQYGLFEDLKLLLIKQEPVKMMLFGGFRFSQVNELYGYTFGNLVLQKIVMRLRKDLYNAGDLYRLDGTRFVLVTRTLSLEELKERYENMRQQFREKINIDGRWLNLTMHGGALALDTFDVDDRTVLSCLTHAYEESKNGHQGDFYVFSNTLTAKNQKMLELMSTIRSSVVNNCRGFSLFYQPIVDAKTETLKGAEALIRWEDERYGLVSPQVFIPVLESDALFPRLGTWILRKGMMDTKKILEAYPDFQLNINLSYAQLEKEDFVEAVRKILKETGYPPENLCLEITERCRLINLEHLQEIIQALNEDGVRFALDDFCTGYSSLDVLRNLQCSLLKIDRQFVRNICEDEKAQKFIDVITQLAAIYGAGTCVEGVESEEMRDILQRYQVTSLQGFLYDKPQPLEAFCRKYVSE